jgi:putative ABC transport system permease protein
MSLIYALSFASIILMVVALANYANLNIGMADFSGKFLFISKVSGSTVWETLKYFLYEAIIITGGSVMIAIIITAPASHLIRTNFGTDLLSGNGSLIITVIAIFSVAALAAGLMPLLKQGLSAIVATTDYKINSGYRRKGISKSIIIIQFTISIALMISVMVIRRQTNYALGNSMGFNRDNLICLEDVHTGVQEKFEVFKEELLKYSAVKSVSAMFEPPGGETNDRFRFEMEGYTGNKGNKSEDYIGIFPCDYSFTTIFSLNFLAGTGFSATNEDVEGSGEYIINESAMKRLNFTDPSKITGKEFRLITGIDGVNIPAGRIIGVVQDFHLSTMRKAVEPLVLFKRKDLWLINFVISFQPGMKDEALADLKSVWGRMFPGYPLQYNFVGAMYEKVYRTEILQARLLSLFTVVALFICSIGMLGLTLLTTQRRTKEIGIRKINGALTGEIMIMINIDLVKWILLALLFAIPISYYLMFRWLGYFAYKRPVSWIIFAIAGVVAIVITLITISYQSWRASSRNPVESLRYE